MPAQTGYRVLNLGDSLAVFGQMAWADALDVALLELALEGYYVASGGAVTGNGDLTVSVATGVDSMAGKEVRYAAQTSGSLLATALAGKTCTDGVTTNGSAVITSATIGFDSTCVGRPISGTNIPAGTTILSVQSATQATMTANATASGTGISFTCNTNDRRLLVEIASDGTLKVDNFADGPASGYTPWPTPTAGRVVHARAYIDRNTITIVDATSTGSRGKIIDNRVLRQHQPRGSQFFRSWVEMYDEFFGDDANNVGSLPWALTEAGTTGTVRNDNAVGGAYPGVVSLATGTNSAGNAGISFAPFGSAVRLGGKSFTMDWFGNLSTVSDGTNTYSHRFGLIDSTTGESTDGIYFAHRPGTDANANWYAVTRGASTETKSDTGIALDGATHRFTIVYDAEAGTPNVKFYIDDVLVATHTANIPTTAHYGAPGAMILKSAGGTSRSLRFDYFYWLRAR